MLPARHDGNLVGIAPSLHPESVAGCRPPTLRLDIPYGRVQGRRRTHHDLIYFSGAVMDIVENPLAVLALDVTPLGPSN